MYNVNPSASMRYAIRMENNEDERLKKIIDYGLANLSVPITVTAYGASPSITLGEMLADPSNNIYRESKGAETSTYIPNSRDPILMGYLNNSGMLGSAYQNSSADYMGMNKGPQNGIRHYAGGKGNPVGYLCSAGGKAHGSAGKGCSAGASGSGGK